MGKEKRQFDPLQFAALIAHQLQSPVAAAESILRSLLGGYQGPLSDEQRDFIARAGNRCGEAIQSARRMLTIARAIASPQASAQTTDLAALLRLAHQRFSQEAGERGITLALEIEAEPIHVRFSREALVEVLDEVVSNAMKYTPDNGQVRISAQPDESRRNVAVAVADSGVGIAQEDMDKVFEPYYRAATRGSTRAGMGLGLTLVRAAAEAAGGSVAAARSDLGGTQITIVLPLAPEPAEAAEEPEQGRGMKVVIVGGVAAGPKVASKIIRLDPEAEVTIVEKGKFLSYAGCGLPYYVSGVVKSQRNLMSTPLGVVRDAVFFQNVRNVRVRNDTEAVRIDRSGKRVLVQDLFSGIQTWLDYDKLVLATGATPIVPEVPGVSLTNVFTLHGVHDAEGIKTALAETQAQDVVVVGGGLIGVEFTSCLVDKGCRVTIVERLPHILPMLDWEMAALVERHLESRGVRVLTSTNISHFQGPQKVAAVVTDRGTLPANLVILGIGVRPNVTLAREAGLQIGQTGGIKVDACMRTSDSDIFAAGDCVESFHLVTRREAYVPMGSLANKQGRVVAVNVCGGSERFPGVLGSTICQVFDYCVAKTGITEAHARKLGYEVVTALAPAPDAEHFMPGAAMLLLKIVADARSRRLLGAQGIGPGRADKRIDAAAMAITGGMTVDRIANADLCYAPQYAPAMDNLITAANIARNKLDGHMHGISAEQVHQMLQRGESFVFLDVRSPGEWEKVRLPGSTPIPLGALRGRLSELPRELLIVTFDNLSLRGYEAALILKANGFKDVRVLDGGIEMWPFKKLH